MTNRHKTNIKLLNKLIAINKKLVVDPTASNEEKGKYQIDLLMLEQIKKEIKERMARMN